MWCMIYDYQCSVIVALNDPDQVEDSCGIYIPREGSAVYGHFTVEYVYEQEDDNITETTLRLYQTNKDDALQIKHFQYKGWKSDSNIPHSSDSFVNLVTKIKHVTDNNPSDTEDQKIAVVCLDGVSRCSVFCAVKSVIDEMKETQHLNVFQAVKRLKRFRYEMLGSKEQYVFCYESARAYLRSFATYENVQL
ncbi:receptor-type tyrosine-protein phosphatase alpha-like [Amphiura filiformis]|uniref:receptor-type tyrosine-protein phosphatase alpha-like n=1 Tax=Amphiura filiformis TaxID=82378 RepID=UPI003B21021E